MVDAKYTKFYAVHAVRQSNAAEANASYHINEPVHVKTYVMSYANKKCAGQPAHSRSLVSAFVVRCLVSIISLDSIVEISRVELASLSCAGQFVSGLVGNSRRHVMSCRSSNLCLYIWPFYH